MKKLMIAAALVALAGVTMAECEKPTPAYCVLAYRVKLAGKTVTGKQSSKTFNSNPTVCDYESDCWAKPASYRVAGYLYSWSDDNVATECDKCACVNLLGGEVKSVFWDGTTKQEVFKDALEPIVADILRNGGAKNKMQIAFKLGDLTLAGFGTYNQSTLRLKSASGFFAGTIDAPKCAGAYDSATCEWGEAKPAKIYTICTDEAKEAEKAIAYGRWSFTWSSSKVAKFSANQDETIFHPTGFIPAN